MRTVGEIVEAVQEQQPVTEAELRLALLCLFYDGQLACPSDFEGASELRLRMRAQESFSRRFRMLREPADLYLGARWTPGSEENTTARRASKAIASAALRRPKP